MTRLLLVSTFALAAMTTTPALAAEQVWATGDGFTIRATGLDLSSRNGRAALLRRIEEAGQRVCAAVTPRIDRRACQDEATQTAVAAAAPTLRAAVAAAQHEQNDLRLAGR